MRMSRGPSVFSCGSVLRVKRKLASCPVTSRALPIWSRLYKPLPTSTTMKTSAAHFTRDAHGHVVGKPAVNEQPPVDFDRVKSGRNGHAGANGFGEAARGQHDFLARLDVRRDGAIRDGHEIEVLHLEHRERQSVEHEIELLPADEGERELDLAFVVSGLGLDYIEVVIALAAK